MNAAEAAQDKLEREEGTRDRKAVEAAYRKEREETLAAKREQVKKVKQQTDQSVVEEALAWAAQKREQAAAARRQQRAELQEAKRKGKDGDFITHKGMYIFTQSTVVIGEPQNVFLEADAPVTTGGILANQNVSVETGEIFS